MTDLVAQSQCPRWRTAITAHMDRITLARPRSWDIWADVMSPAYDDVRDDIGDAIAVTVAFLEYLTDEKLTDKERRMVAVGIRQHGKAFAWGLSRAVGATEEWSMSAWFRYARGAARRLDAERKDERNGR